MKILSAAAAAAAFASIVAAAPAVAQPGSYVAGNFSVMIDGKPYTSVKTVEFDATPTPQASADRAAPKTGATAYVLKLGIVRSADTLFDDWLASGPGTRRNVSVEILTAAGKPQGKYDFDRCWLMNGQWKLDAAAKTLTSETWTVQCETAKRS